MRQTLLSGLLRGGNYALLGIGYTLVLGVTRLLTLAHGQVFVVAGIAGAVVMRDLGAPLAVGIATAVAAGTAAGILTDLLCFRPLHRAPPSASAVATIGLAVAMQTGILLWLGAESIGLPPGLRSGDVRVGSLLVPRVELLALFLALGLMVATRLFVRRTRWGIAMRAMAENPEAAQIVGVNVRAVATVTLGLSGFLAGAAAIVLALRVGSVNPVSGAQTGLIGLAVIVIGGLGNVTGAMIAGVALGIVEALAEYYGVGGLAAVPWLLVIVVLIVRPQGLLGQT